MSAPNNSVKLRYRVIHAGSWTITGYALNQLLRFAGNLILTRLLFPEAFGLMAIVSTVIVGVTMLSDMGVSPCIVQNKRGNDPVFLNTAWTLQVVRGTVLWSVLWLLSEQLAVLYGQPLLSELLPVAGLTAFIEGFNSTNFATANRRLEATRVVMIEVGSYASGLIVTVVWAWVEQTIWALVWGGLIGAMIKMVASHILLHGVRNRFHWDRASAKTIFGFGQWIFISSLITFLAGEGNKLLIGAVLEIQQLAFYTLASTMNLMFLQASLQIATNVLFPSYAEIVRDRPKDLYAALKKSRIVIIVPGWLVSVFFVFLGEEVIQFLYDARYADAGIMLQVLALGSLAGIVTLSYSGVLLAKGMVGKNTMLQALHVFVQILAMLIGYKVTGVNGLVAGLAIAQWVAYCMMAIVISRLSLWHPKLDLSFLGFSVLVVLMSIY